MGNLIQALYNLPQKDWSIYPFVSPVFSLFFSLFLSPLYGNLFEKKLRDYLKKEDVKSEELIKHVNQITKDRALQIAYLTSIPSFLISTIATVKADYPFLLLSIFLIGLFAGLPLFLIIFLNDPGTHAATTVIIKPETKLIKKLFFKYPAKKKWTYLDLYSRLLVMLNLVLIIIIVIATPQKGLGVSV
jgi:hypothetical protein